MEQGKLPDGKQPKSLAFDRREHPREDPGDTPNVPGIDNTCIHSDTEICGRCGEVC